MKKDQFTKLQRNATSPRIFQWHTLNIVLFLTVAAFITSFLNIPQFRTFAPLALAHAIKLQLAPPKVEAAASPAAPTSGDTELDRLILRTGDRYGVDPRLIHFVILQESGYRANIVSPKGACGLMQLMPSTARRFACEDLNNPRVNLDAGTKHMRWLLERYDGDLERALAAYNAGANAVDEYDGVPPYTETRGYVHNIINNYGKKTHPVLSPENARREFKLTIEENEAQTNTTSVQTIPTTDAREETLLR